MESTAYREAIEVAVLGWVLIGGAFISYRIVRHYQRMHRLRHPKAV